MQVELVTIGDELLRGATVNSNATWLGRELTERGVDVTRISVIPDDIDTIARVVNDARERADAVITTGGLGPTHDDRTMTAIAQARGVALEEHPDAIEWLETETAYERDDLATGTLELPAGSRFIPNDVGVAPGAEIDGIYVLPGVPDEMEGMFGLIADEFTGVPKHEIVLEIDQREQAIAPLLETIESAYDVRVGSYPGGTVRVRIVGEHEASVTQAAAWLRDRVELA